MTNFPPSEKEFELELSKELNGCSFKPDMIGLSNCFEHSTFQCEADYYRYLRERVFRNLCAKAAQSEVDHYKKNLIVKFFLLCAAFCLFTYFFIIPHITESVHDEGYRLGYTEGKSSGYTLGEENGYSQGYSVGFEYGHEAGKDSGYESGYEEGHYDGYHEGYGDAEYDNIPMTFPNGLALLPGLDQMIFYSTPWGECYHRKNCPYVTTAMPIRYANAVYAGFSACTYCLP